MDHIIEFNRKQNDFKQRLKVISRQIEQIRDFDIYTKDNLIFIYITIVNELGQKVKLKETFDNVREVEKFIEYLTYSYFIAKFTDQKITVGTIDGSLYLKVNENLLSYDKAKAQYQHILRTISSLLREAINEFKNIANETSKIYYRINLWEEDINFNKKVMEEIKKKSFFSKRKSIADPSGTPLHIDITDIYTINLNEIFSYLTDQKEDINSEINNILTAIFNMKEIDVDYIDYTMVENCNAFEIIKLISLLEQLTEKIRGFNKTITEFEQNRKKEAQELADLCKEADRSNKKTAINIINSITIPDRTIPNITDIEIESITPYIPTASYESEKWENATQRNSEVLKDIQIQQLEKLTKEEREAIIIYKTIFYRPINNVLEFLRNNNITLEEAVKNDVIFKRIIELITNHYEKYISDTNKAMANDRNYNVADFGVATMNEIAKRHNGFLKHEDFIDMILKSIPLIESAIQKVVTIEDIVVYRGIIKKPDTLPISNHFMSTTTDFSTTETFIYDNERNKEGTGAPVLIKIIIPKGSNIIAFTDDLFHGTYSEEKIFNEPQQEILIDPKNFDFECMENKHALGTEITMITYIAHPQLTKSNRSSKNL